jgi:hypothetical protein
MLDATNLFAFVVLASAALVFFARGDIELPGDDGDPDSMTYDV